MRHDDAAEERGGFKKIVQNLKRNQDAACGTKQMAAHGVAMVPTSKREVGDIWGWDVAVVIRGEYCPHLTMCSDVWFTRISPA